MATVLAYSTTTNICVSLKVLKQKPRLRIAFAGHNTKFSVTFP